MPLRELCSGCNKVTTMVWYQYLNSAQCNCGNSQVVVA